jgi:hypothetical protein
MLTLKDSTQLLGARSRANGFPVRVYDDGMGPLWMFGCEYGVTMIIRALSFETAWEIAIDESPTIDATDVPEAYGVYGDDAERKLRQAVELAEAGDGEYPELVEGYEFQSNATGTGIVDVGHYAWLRQMRREDTADYRVVIRPWDHDAEAATFTLDSYAYTMTVRGKSKAYTSYSLLSDVGSRLRKLERAVGAVSAEIAWASV